MRRAASIAIVLALGAGCRQSAEPPAADGAGPTELARLATEAFERRLADDPLLALREARPVERLPDLGYPHAEQGASAARAALERLAAVSDDTLSHDDWLTREVLRFDLEYEAEGLEWYWHENVLAPYSSPVQLLPRIFAQLPLDGAPAVDRYLALFGQVPAFVEQLHARADGQLERGIVLPKPNLAAAVALLRAHAQPAAQSPFAVADGRLAALDESARAGLRAGIASGVENINRRLSAFADFVEQPYAERAPAEVGARHMPDGERYYRFAARRSTTMDATPEDIHQRGARLVAAIEDKMAALRSELGFTGTREEFHHQLRTDARYFPKTPEEVGARLDAVARAFEARVDEYFTTRPAAGWQSRRLDPSLEGSQTYGYYDPPSPADPRGVYYYNGSALDTRSWVALENIGLHELIPGHHFHIARQVENRTLPDYRRHQWHGAYTEGWASYASELGLEAGVYSEPITRYGYYMLDVFLASRLVVDTGMNLLGWSLEQGRAYLRDHTLESENQINTESLRYSADVPGQALAYQMGKQRILELRQQAREALGERFDIRRFHEAVLAPGSLPIAVLERHVAWFIEQERQGR